MIPYCINCQGARPYHYEQRKKQLVCVCDGCGSEIMSWPMNDPFKYRDLYRPTWFGRWKLVCFLNENLKKNGWSGGI